MPVPEFPQRSDSKDRCAPRKAKNVVQVANVAPFRAQDEMTLDEYGSHVRSKFLRTTQSRDRSFDRGRGHYLVHESPMYPSMDIFHHLRSYLDFRLNSMFDAVYPELQVDYSHFYGDDKIVWSRYDTELPIRFAAMVMVKPGSLDESSFKSIIATSDDQELELSALPASATDAITKLRQLYNDYGCCNIAICDFDKILAVDMRPLIARHEPRKLAKAEFSPMGLQRKDWRRFQNTLLGFLERGVRWTTPCQTSD